MAKKIKKRKSLLITLDPTPLAFDLDIIALDGSLEGLEDEVTELIEEQLVGMLLTQIAALALPQTESADRGR